MTPLRTRISLAAVVIFYGLMATVAVGLSRWLLDTDGLRIRLDRVPVWQSGVAGGLVGGAFIGLHRFLEARSSRIRELSRSLSAHIGHVTMRDAAVMSTTSALGEELFFRGFVLPALIALGTFVPVGADAWVAIAIVLSALVFGLAHYSSVPELKVWWIFAAFAGLLLGALTVWSGDVIAAVVAHLTINYFNLLALAGEQKRI